MQRVSFTSNGINIVGNLYLPEEQSHPAPAIPIIGPMTFIKEQAPTEYARRLAQAGFVALVFDPRYHGESGGEPRRWEHPLAKVADLRAALDFLASRPEVDPSRLAGLAVCQGSSEMIRALAEDNRFQVGATIAGHYRDYDADLEWLGSENRDRRLERGWKARIAYAETGAIDYVPQIDPTRTDVGMPGDFVYNWYRPWVERGWENRYAVMSDADLLTYESLSAASRLRKPYLMIHSDQSFLPNTARRHFEAIPGDQKKLSWEGETPHFAYYDQAPVLDATTDKVVRFFRDVLA